MLQRPFFRYVKHVTITDITFGFGFVDAITVMQFCSVGRRYAEGSRDYYDYSPAETLRTRKITANALAKFLTREKGEFLRDWRRSKVPSDSYLRRVRIARRIRSSSCDFMIIARMCIIRSKLHESPQVRFKFTALQEFGTANVGADGEMRKRAESSCLHVPSALSARRWSRLFDRACALRFHVFILCRSCGNCPSNQTDCLANHCVSADGQRRSILTANRQMPGPSIQVWLRCTLIW